MGKINVEGLGIVEIEGNEPNEIENKLIINKLKTIERDRATTQAAEKSTSDFFSGPGFTRLLIELGLSVGGAALTGGLAIPAMVARNVAMGARMLSKDVVFALAKSSAGSGAGGALGSVVAQPIDPTDDVVKDAVKAGISYGLAEAVGTPLFLKGSQYVAKVLGNRTPKRIFDEVEGAAEAEAVLKAQAEKIKENPREYAAMLLRKDIKEVTEKDIQKLVADYVNDPMITLGIRGENRALDILEKITEASLIGGGRIATVKEIAAKTADARMLDIQKKFIDNTGVVEAGDQFIKALQGSREAFKSSSNAMYKFLTDSAPNVKIPVGGLKDDLTKIIDEVGGPKMSGIEPLLKQLRNLNNKIEEFGGELPYKQLIALRRNLNIAVDEAAPKLGEKSSTLFRDLVMYKNKLDDTINNPKFFPEEFRALHKEVNDYYAKGSQAFNKGILASVFKKEGAPDQVFDVIIKNSSKARGEKPFTVEATLNVIDDLQKTPGKKLTAEGALVKTDENILTAAEAKGLKDKLRGHFLSNILRQSEKQSGIYGQYFDSQKFSQLLADNRTVFNKLFSDTEQDLFFGKSGIERVLAFSQGEIAKRGGIPGPIFIQLKQAGAATQLGGALLTFGGAAGAAYGTEGYVAPALILLTPVALSRALTSPKISKMLFESYSAKNLDKMSPSKAGLLYRQILGKMVDENIINSDQYIEAAGQSERVENQLNEMGVKTARDLKPSTSLQVPSSSQTNLAPINTQITQPRANLFTTQQPTLPPAPTPTPMATALDRSQQYAGLFPFDITGQQIARQG